MIGGTPTAEALVERRRLRYLLEERGLGPPGRPVTARTDRPDGVRVAVISSPRSGNTLLRSLLAQTLDLVELPVHHPADLDWDHLPARAVIQLHWPRTAHLERLLAGAGTRVVTLARDPLDVLVSVLSRPMSASPAGR